MPNSDIFQKVKYGDNGAASTSIFTCSEDGCSCSNSNCHTMTVAVNRMSGESEKEGCKIGDRVKVSRGDQWTLKVCELEVFSEEGK